MVLSFIILNSFALTMSLFPVAVITISALENLVAAAERRALLNGEEKTTIRVLDFVGVVPAITGKVELVYEGEQECPYEVALNLLNMIGFP